MKCFVPSCVSDFHQASGDGTFYGLSKHCFPKDPQRCIQWLQAIADAENVEIQINNINFNTARLCSLHFEAASFYVANKRRRLKKDAVPNLFSSNLGVRNEFLAGSEKGIPMEQFNIEGIPTRTFKQDLGSNSGISHTQHDHGTIGIRSSRARSIRYFGDINRIDNVSGEEALKALPKLKNQFCRTSKTNKLLRAQNKRLRDRLTSMSDLIQKLQEKKFATNHLQGFATDNNLICELSSRQKGNPYTDAVRCFATSLHFYSARAYNYVREVFENMLPHPRTLIRWYESVNGEPGITSEALDVLRAKAAEYALEGKSLFCCLLMDEMAIRQHVQWNQHTKKLDGLVQHHGLPTKVNSKPDEAQVAKEALVFMVTGIQESWKVTVGYFLINGINAIAKSELVSTLLTSLHDVGAHVIAFTFDGTKCNLATANRLGCDFRTDTGHKLKTSFSHPCADYEVSVFLDAVHMIKLVRNTLHSKGTLHTMCGAARWNDIILLNEHQNNTGLRIATKLSDKHVNFTDSKMKVVLAVQTISNSVASALDYLRQTNEKFSECNGTIEFLNIFNDIFDVLNSMSAEARGFKRPLSKENFDVYYHAFQYVEDFIRSITLSDGTPILQSPNKTGFLGLLIDIQSIRNLYHFYCENSNELDEIYTYRLSQDHLETFFGAVRSKGGSNNNPNAGQFKASYKRMLLQNNVSCSSKANCSSVTETKSLATPGKKDQSTLSETGTGETTPTIPLPNRSTDNYESFMNDDYINTSISKSALEVHKKILAETKCTNCVSNILQDEMKSITSVCKTTEFNFKAIVGDFQNIDITIYYDGLVDCMLEHFRGFFGSLWALSVSNEYCGNDHKLALIRRTIIIYLDMRIKLYAENMKPFKATNRQKLTKLILFEGN